MDIEKKINFQLPILFIEVLDDPGILVLEDRELKNFLATYSDGAQQRRISRVLYSDGCEKRILSNEEFEKLGRPLSITIKRTEVYIPNTSP